MVLISNSTVLEKMCDVRYSRKRGLSNSRFEDRDYFEKIFKKHAFLNNNTVYKGLKAPNDIFLGILKTMRSPKTVTLEEVELSFIDVWAKDLFS